MSIHTSHRQRVKDRFRAEGLDSFDEVHALELLLFYAIPQGDVNPLAHRLLDHFGNLRQVLEAPTEHLLAVEGVGNHTAMLLGLVKGMARKYLISSEGKSKPLTTLEACGDYLKDRLVGRRDETVMLLCLDAKRKVLGCRIISEGSVNSAEVSTRKVMDAALTMNATSVSWPTTTPAASPCPAWRMWSPPAGWQWPWMQWASCWRTTSWWRTGTMFPCSSRDITIRTSAG